MASMKAGLKTSGPEFERMLNMSGGYRKPNEAAEKLDFLESISGKVMENIERGQKMTLSLDNLIRFLNREAMTPERDAKVVVSQLIELKSRERRRLGKHVTPKQEKEDMNFALVLLAKASKEVVDVFGTDERKPGPAPIATVAAAEGLAGSGGTSKRSHSALLDSPPAIDAAALPASLVGALAPAAESAAAETATAEEPASEGHAAKRARLLANRDNPPAVDASASPLCLAGAPASAAVSAPTHTATAEGPAADSRAVKRPSLTVLEQLMQLVPLALEDGSDTSENARADLKAEALTEITRILQASKQGLEILKGSTTVEKRNDLVRIALLLLPQKNLVPTERRSDADSAMMLALEAYLALSK